MPIGAAHAHRKELVKAKDTTMKTFHEWLAEGDQRQCEGLWLNDMTRRSRAPISETRRQQSAIWMKTMSIKFCSFRFRSAASAPAP